MKCRAWETTHQNDKKYLHVVAEELEVEVVKEIAERVAKSPLAKDSITPVLRDVSGSYLIADKGNESIGFGAFVPLDSHILEDFRKAKEALRCLLEANKTYAQALMAVMEKLGLTEEK